MRIRRPLIVAAHAVLFAMAYALAFGFRFDFAPPSGEIRRMLATLPVLLVLRSAVFWAFHLYEGLWRYVSIRDVVELIKAVTLSSAIFIVGVQMSGGRSFGFPRSVLVLDAFFCLGLTAGLRISARLLLEHRLALAAGANGERKRAIVVGVGDVAEALLREIGRGSLPYTVVGLASEDPTIHGRRLHGIPVLGGLEDISQMCATQHASEVLIATEGTSTVDRRVILEGLKDTGIEVRTVPALTDLLIGRAVVGELRKVQNEELLGRATIGTNVERLREALSGRRVLVTGGAGSIGSELARQIAAFDPETLVLFDRAESDLYLTHASLCEQFEGIKIEAAVGDILDEQRVGKIFGEYSPQLVYHAAAYKHVPLMEAHPLEAIKNNVLGTDIVATASVSNGVGEFVLISTDKAVRPVGVMGMTKRAAEFVVRARANQGTTFVAVRFGNVLGSNGSVLSLFHQQLRSGSAVTVTDPDALRYFMMTSEAVELVLQAGALGRDGEVYVLNTGEPIRMGDLAENFVRLSGLEPGVDVPIKVTGLRPGERLAEELIDDGEEVMAGPHEKVLVVQEPGFDRDAFLAELEALKGLVAADRAEGAVSHLRALVGKTEQMRPPLVG
ncbi:MAG: nucleoside-diphosphate sugar epimerase/dehydratase [Actinomycetota bacterium]